jgi:hypothetical protein
MLVAEMRRVRVVIGSENEGFSLVQGLVSSFLVLGTWETISHSPLYFRSFPVESIEGRQLHNHECGKESCV